MKKITALLLAVVMCLAVLTACGTDSASDWDYISEKGELVIGITLFAPMNYYETEGGDLVGFETEFATAVCQKLGVNAKFQVIDWNSKETELNSRNIDCIWNGMTIDEDRKANMDISVPYMQNKQVLVTKAENAGVYTTAEALTGAAVVAEIKSAGESVAQADPFFAAASYTAVDAQSKVLFEIKSGTADVGVIDYVMTIGSIGAGTDYEDIAVVEGIDFAPEQYGIAFRKNSPVTLEKVNGAIAELMADGTMDTIAAKYKLAELLIK